MSKKAKIIAGSIVGGVIAAAVAVIFIVIPLAQQGALNARYDEAIRIIEYAKKNEDEYWRCEDALEILNEINSDKFNVEKDIVECQYYIGSIGFKKENYHKAVKYLEPIQDYKDSYKLIQESWYQIGLNSLHSGGINAYECFEKPILKGYKDSEKLAEEARQLEFKWWHAPDEYDKQVAGYQKLK